MKVHVYKQVSVKCVVPVYIADITAALAGELDDNKLPSSTEGQRRAVEGFLNSVYMCLRAVSDEMIAAMKASNRELVAEKFQEQVDRFIGKRAETKGDDRAAAHREEE